MNSTVTLTNAPLSGEIRAIPSKSMAHRLLICAYLANSPTDVVCNGTSKDIEATRACLSAMDEGNPLPCGESGSTLRFLLPVVSALGLETEFHMEGRLPQRPLGELEEQLCAHGVMLTRPQEDILQVRGRLTPGDFTLPGNVSSQYVSGLLFALPLLDSPSTLTVQGKLESAPYVEMTLWALRQFGIAVQEENGVYTIPACGYHAPGQVTVEGDWSNAGFWLCAGALGKPVTVTGLDRDSLQGDKAVFDILAQFGAKTQQTADRFTVSPGKLQGITMDASAIPDLVPVLSVVAAAAEGTTYITGAGRLRLKESDRLASVSAMLRALGGEVEEREDGLVIHGGKLLSGGTVDSWNDHRIAMSAAVAACLCRGSVTVAGANAVEKSYPRFWEDFRYLQQT